MSDQSWTVRFSRVCVGLGVLGLVACAADAGGDVLGDGGGRRETGDSGGGDGNRAWGSGGRAPTGGAQAGSSSNGDAAANPPQTGGSAGVAGLARHDGGFFGERGGAGGGGGASGVGGVAATGGLAAGGRSGLGGNTIVGGWAGQGGAAAAGGALGRGGAVAAAVGGANGGGGSSGATGGSSGHLFVGYFQTWSEHWAAEGSATTLARLPSYVNVVNLSFMRPDANYTAGTLSLGGTGVDVPYDGATLKAAVAALHASHPDTKVFISVGGATYTNWAGFVPRTIAAFVGDFGIDGVDIDYEPATADCKSAQGTVSCPSDAEFIAVVKNMRSALPRPALLSMAAFSVGAYGEASWVNATPPSAHTGITLAVLKDKEASAGLDLVNVMSYDAGPTYDPTQALAAYRHYFEGKIAMGIEVPPEAWGGHVYTIAEIDSLAQAVKANGGAGLMLWSIQKAGPTQSFATEMCLQLGLSDCTTPML